MNKKLLISILIIILILFSGCTLKIDEYIVTIDSVHAKLHQGYYYTYSAQATLNSGEIREILIVTGEYDTHFINNIRGTSEFNVTLYEDSIISSNGILQTTVNRNRPRPKNSTNNIYITPTITNLGFKLLEAHGGNGQKTGGETRTENEFILKPNSKYVLRIVSESANNDISYNIGYYLEQEN